RPLFGAHPPPWTHERALLRGPYGRSDRPAPRNSGRNGGFCLLGERSPGLPPPSALNHLTIPGPDVSFAPLLPSSEDVVNDNSGLIGTKLGHPQIFTDDGEVVRVTAIQAGPCVVVGTRTPEQHGYSAVQIGFGKAREKNVSKPEAGFYKKAGVEAPRVVREFRLPEEEVAKLEVGQTLSPADIFTEGQFVDVTGVTKGRGFTGVMERHNFAGAATKTHGTHEYKRHGGSI